MNSTTPKEININVLNEIYFNVYMHREAFIKNIKLNDLAFSNLRSNLSCEYLANNIKLLFETLRCYKKHEHLFEDKNSILPVCSFIDDFNIGIALNINSNFYSDEGLNKLFKIFNFNIDELNDGLISFDESCLLASKFEIDLEDIMCESDFLHLNRKYIYSPHIDKFLLNSSKYEQAQLLEYINAIFNSLTRYDSYTFCGSRIASKDEINLDNIEFKSNSSYLIEYNTVAYEDYCLDSYIDPSPYEIVELFLQSFFNLISFLNKKAS